ncbi:MAG: DUF1599 domain-containing protein [Bacteroides sp.]|nr:DUF1599 domain-containing protein [Bacteroides sp.]
MSTIIEFADGTATDSRSEVNHLVPDAAFSESAAAEQEAAKYRSADSRREQTVNQFKSAIVICRNLFIKKMEDYGLSWRFMRPESLTDQIMIKALRIRSLETKGGRGQIDEGIEPEFIGIVNYSTIALIQLQLGEPAGLTLPGLSPEEALMFYDEAIDKATGLMLDKNHDYDEAWRSMRVSSFTDIILQKILRTKEIENHNGQTVVSEGIDANYMDMINYALFALIKLSER